MEKQLRRSKQDSVLGGVAGGLARYFNIDVVIVRLLFVISLFVSFGVSLFAYIILWVVLPEEPYYHFGNPEQSTGDTPVPADTASAPESNNGDRNLKIVAIGLIGFGTYMLLDQYIAWYSLGKYFWPLALIGIGAFLLLRKRDQDYESSLQRPGQDPPRPDAPAGPAAPAPGPDASAPDRNEPSGGSDEPGESFKVN